MVTCCLRCIAVAKRGVWTNRANVLSRKDDLTDAVELQPGVAACWTNRGYVRKLAGDFDGPTSDLSHALELDPTVAELGSTKPTPARPRTILQGQLPTSRSSSRLIPTAWTAALDVVMRSMLEPVLFTD